MKELVDFKLGKKPMDRYVRDYDYTHLNQEPDEKFRKMSERLHAQDSSDDDESIVSEVEEEKPKERKIRFEDTMEETSESSSEESESSTSASEATVKPASEDEPSSTEEAKDSVQSETSTTTGRTQSFEVSAVSDADKLRFLLSGHIRNNLKPIFIIHEYNGKSPFGKTADFSSTKNEGDVDLYISGKFYKDSVLEEVNNKLLSLNIKPEKILIDERSKVYEEQFYQLLRVGKVKVDFEGKFVKQLDTKKYTPFLTFNVQNYPKVKRSKNKSHTKKPAAVVYIAEPESRNIFAQKKQGDEAKVVKRNVSGTPSVYEPHLKKNPSRRASKQESARRGRDAGDVGSEGGLLVYNCDVNRRKSSKDKNIFRRLSHMFFSRN